jgi:hypothetical protein
MRVEVVREAATTPEPELPEGMEAHHIDASTGDDEFARPEVGASQGIVAPEDRDPEDESTFRACRQADANRGQTAEAVYALKPRQVIGHCDFKFEYRHLGPVGTAGVPTAGQTVS